MRLVYHLSPTYEFYFPTNEDVDSWLFTLLAWLDALVQRLRNVIRAL